MALRDWLRFGENPADPARMCCRLQWARYYVEHSRSEVYDWLLAEGLKFMPAVNWVERGMLGDGNSCRATTSSGAPRAN
jgi:predicted oxidoreductase